MAASLPTGFEETEIASELASPTAMAVAPDGRIFVLEQGGKVIVVKNGAKLPNPALQLDVDRAGERGLLGITFHPQFATNSFVYLYYTVPVSPARNRVSRFVVTGDTIVRSSETILLEIPLGVATIHNAGSLGFGADGKLYIATGENSVPANAQSTGNLLGKILRLEPDGNIPADNPFPQASGINRAIWALGFRNPFSFSIQPGTGKIYINDVGQSAFEEVNEGAPGANYGWPETEGFSPDPRFRNPVHAYWHVIAEGGECAITGGAFYNPPAGVVGFPNEFTGSYFFTDYCSGWIRRLAPGQADPVAFATGLSFPVALAVGTDGSILTLERGSYDSFAVAGSLRRIRYTGQQKPVLTTQPRSQLVSVGQSVTFSVEVSGTAPITYQWTRNGAPIAGATGSAYTLASPALTDNSIQFRVTATNAHGNVTSDPAVLSVTANRPPVATIVSPTAGARYAAGDTISYSGTATDPETGALPASAFTWRVDFHHDTHSHPFIAPVSGSRNGTFVVPRTGEWAATVFYRIHLSVTDAAGLTHSTYTDIVPRVVTLHVQTDPPGLLASLDSWERIAPFSQPGVIGMQRELSLRQTQTLNGLTYKFTSWSDGGAATHTAVTPGTDITYTARFTLVNNCSLTVAPGTITLPASGGSGTVTLTATGDTCVWAAQEAVPWLQVFPISGTTSGPLTWTVYPNYSTRARFGTVTVGSSTVTFQQAPATGTADERFVGQLYSSFFGRLALPAEVAFQVNNALARGVPRSELTMRFFNSDEFANAGLFVAGLYMGLLRRDAEYSGWLFQRNALAAGYIRPDQMVANFIASPEFTLTYGTLSDAGFADLLYRNILRRPPTAAELDFQTAVLRTGTTRVQMAMQFLRSAEFRLNSGPRLQSFLAFATLLQRDPTPAELTAREEQIRTSGSPSSVVADFIRSPEFALLLQ